MVLSRKLLQLLGTGSLVEKPGFYRLITTCQYRDRAVVSTIWLPDPEESEPLAPTLEKACKAWCRTTHCLTAATPAPTNDEIDVEFKMDESPVPASKKRRKEPNGIPNCGEPTCEVIHIDDVAAEIEATGEPETPCIFCTGCEMYQCDLEHDPTLNCHYCDAIWNHFQNCF